MNGKGATCAIVGVWEVLGRRWSLHILKNLHTKEVIRFNELKRSLPGISSTVLSERLLELEAEAFLSLCGEEKTQDRLQHMIEKGKPLRN